MRELLPFLLFVCLLQFSCKGKTGNPETETGISHPGTSGNITIVQNSNTIPADTNSDTLTINSRSAVFFQPDSLQIENRKKEAGEANFRAGAGDYIYYINTSVDYLGKQDLPVLDAKDRKYLRFVSASGVVNENFTSQKDSDIGEGYMLTKPTDDESSEVGGDPFAPDAKKISVIDDAESLISLIGGADFNINSLSDIASKNINHREKLLSILESLAGAKDAGEKAGDVWNRIIEGLEAEKRAAKLTSATPRIEPGNSKKGPPYKMYFNGKPAPNEKSNGQARRTTPDEGIAPDTIFYDNPKSQTKHRRN